MMRWAPLVLAACRGTTQPAVPPTIEVADYSTAPSHQLDVLMLIDNTAVEAQYGLSLAMPALVASLAAIDGGTPDLHIGVATSDLGTSGSIDPTRPAPPIGQKGNGGCLGEGDDGMLRTSGAPVTGTFLTDDGTMRNYTGTLPDALAKMAMVGGGGCGFEQHLAGVRRALARTDNTAFLRDTANLLVLVVGDEDDCSIADPAFFGSDPSLGPLQSFRCTALGITCNEPLDEPGPKTGCSARADSPYVEDIASTIAFLNGLKPETRLATAVIAGTPEPFDIEPISPPGGGTPHLGLLNGCHYLIENTTAAADPGVRLYDFGHSFGSRGVALSVCDSDLSPQLREIGRVTKQLFGTICPDTSKIDPTTCVAEDVDTSTELPYDLTADPAACPETADHLRLVAHGGTHVRVRCTLR